MAFNFGSSSTPTAAPAPAFGTAPAPGGLFGSSAPAPAPGSGGLFGSSAPAPAPGGLFGSSAPASTSGGLFGSSTQAPAPAGGGLFGAPAPAPASGGLFGAPAKAPSSGGLFGAPGPAPASGGLFGAPVPAPGGLFGASVPTPTTGSLFGARAPSAFGAAPLAASAGSLAGHMPYASLPQDQKNNLDSVYQAIMNHKRTILAVSTMAPRLLDASTQQADAGGGGQEVPLSVTAKQLSEKLQHTEQEIKSLRDSMMHTKRLYETSTTQAIRHAQWPTEFVAMRVGVTLNSSTKAQKAPSTTKEEQKKTEEFNRHLKELLDREMTHTDQIYRMPSPYLWQCVEEMEGRAQSLQAQLQSLSQTLEISRQVSTEEFDVIKVIQLQEESIWSVAADLARVHAKIEELRQAYNLQEKGINVLEEERQESIRYQEQMGQQLRALMVKTLPTASATGPVPAPGGGLFGSSTPAPAPVGSLFGKSPSSAFGSSSTGGGLFGSSTPAPAPANGGLYGAPAPAGGGLFGSTTPAPAPAGGGLFGAPAPAPASGGGLFGAPAPAPAFGATILAPTPASATGGHFGAAPAAAPAFGATPAPATGGLFGSTSTSAATPKSKSRSRSSSSRRR